MKNNACKRVSTDREAVELLSSWQRAHKITSIDWDMCWESIEKLPEISMDRESIENVSSRQRAQKFGLMDLLAVEKLSRSNLKISIEETCVELLSRCRQEGIEQLLRRQKQGFWTEEKYTRWMQKDSYSNKHPSSMLSTQTQLKSRCKAFLDQKRHIHTKQV